MDDIHDVNHNHLVKSDTRFHEKIILHDVIAGTNK